MATADPITNPISDPSEPTWFNDMVNDDTPPERVEFLKSFDTQDALIDSGMAAKNANWRDAFAGEDDKFKSQLERYNSPEDLGKAFREQRATISSGNLKQTPDENATPEDLAAFRAANGIPAEASGYLENLPEGLVLGEEDKEIFENFSGAMHEMNVEPQVMHKVIDWYNGFAEDQQDAMAELDNGHHQETEDQLRTEWGTDYRANINLVGSLIETTFGEENASAILNARDAEGRALMNIPGVLQGLADISRQLNPVAQLAPSTGRTADQTLEDEIGELEKFMKDDRKAYNKDEKSQARLRELYQIRIDHEARKTA
ncbi:MAG: hypothetical protein KAI25_07765 [Hyphomicrobiaceae bacterium]|nr:hypothetical protein [Hyphomicrobiaceae bacterium]MCK5712595.1 hypothetical protein [Hyphomicrobiaceae bacterium]